MPPSPQCVEKFHRYHSVNIVTTHNHKILPGNIFGLILRNKMAATGIFSTFSKEYCWPSRAKGNRDLKFARYVPHYKIMTGNIFGLILKNKMAAMGVPLSDTFNKIISLRCNLTTGSCSCRNWVKNCSSRFCTKTIAHRRAVIDFFTFVRAGS